MADKRERQASTASDKSSPSSMPPLKKLVKIDEPGAQGGEVETKTKTKDHDTRKDGNHVQLENTDNPDIQNMFKQIIRGQEKIRRSLESKIDKLRYELKAEFDLKIKAVEEEVTTSLSKMRADIDEFGRRLGVVEIAQVENYIEEADEKLGNKDDEIGMRNRGRSTPNPTPEPFPNDMTVVITGLHGEGEEYIHTCVKEMFSRLDIGADSIVRTKRLVSKVEGRPGLVKCELKTKEDKIHLLRSKHELRNYPNYRRIYIRGSKSIIEKNMESNIRMLLKQIPEGHKYRLTAGGKIVQRDDTRPRPNYRDNPVTNEDQ